MLTYASEAEQARAEKKVVGHVATAAEKRKRILYMALSVRLCGIERSIPRAVSIPLGATYDS